MTYHTTLTPARWAALPMAQRVLAVGSELRRSVHWLARGDREAARHAADRAVELLDLTIDTARPGLQRRELRRARELLRGAFQEPEALPLVRQLTRTLIGEL